MLIANYVYMTRSTLSPHVQIYKFPMTATTSILNRITGLALSGMFLAGSAVPYIYDDIHPLYQSLSPKTKQGLHGLLTFPIVYHTFGGIRHFLWDAYPHLLTNAKATKSSYVLIGSSIVTTGAMQWLFESNKESNS